MYILYILYSSSLGPSRINSRRNSAIIEGIDDKLIQNGNNKDKITSLNTLGLESMKISSRRGSNVSITFSDFSNCFEEDENAGTRSIIDKLSMDIETAFSVPMTDFDLDGEVDSHHSDFSGRSSPALLDSQILPLNTKRRGRAGNSYFILNCVF